MSKKELRIDVLTGRQVIVAAGRAQRPQTVGRATTPARDHYDPFLEGNERDTPEERLALRRTNTAANSTEWLIRVVANRYPAVSEPTESSHAAAGIHDVIIECPDGREHLTDLSPEEVTRILFAWQQRLIHIQRVPEIAAVQIFRNEGFGAGASLPHCHSQILATSFVGAQTTARMMLAGKSERRDRTILFDRWLRSELEAEERVVDDSGNLATICPFASRVPWHTRVVPIDRMPTHFDQLTEQDLASIAVALLSVVQAHEKASSRTPFNLTLTLPPTRSPQAYPWMLDYIPRTSRVAGFELMSDVDILTLTPESAAKQLRRSYPRSTSCSIRESLHPVGYEWTTNH